MALRVGEMMVVVRAQDFASRTLHRVSGELAGMSRQQALAMRGQQIAFQKMRAQASVKDALRSQAGLNTVQAYNSALATQAKRFTELQVAEGQLSKLRGARAGNIRIAEQEIAMARQELDFFRRARQIGVSRKVMPPAARTAGMEQATTRLANAHNMLARASRSSMVAQTDAERALTTAQARYNQASQSVTRLGDRVSKLPGWLRAGANNAFMFANAQSRVNRELQTAYNNLSRAQQAELAFNNALRQLPVQRMHDFGQAMSGVGRTMQLIGASMTLVFGASAAVFANFSNEAALAATQMRDLGAPIAQTVERSKELSAAIVKLTMKFPASAAEMSQAAYDIFSSMNLVHKGVVDVAGGMKLLEIANKVAVAGGTDLKEATNGLILVVNNFGGSLRDTIPLMNTAFNIVRFGYMHVNDLAKAMASLGPAGHAAGLSLASLGGAFAALTIVMQPPQRAAIGLARLIELFRTQPFVKGFHAMGVEVEQTSGKMRPLLSIFRDIVKMRPDLASGQTSAIQFFMQVSKLSGMTKAGIQGTVQARRAFEQLITHMAMFANVSANVVKNKGELDAAFMARLQDPGVQWAIFMNQLKALVLVIGRDAIPVFLALGNKIQGFVQWLNNLRDSTRGTIIRLAAFVGIGTLLGGVFLAIAGSVTTVFANMKLLRMSTKLAGDEAVVAGGKFMIMRNAILAVGFVGLGILLSQVIGLRRAVVVMTTAWLVWKTKALQSIAAVVWANVIGAETVKGAWRTALIATGWGAVAIAAGLAAEYVMTHWNQVRAFFAALWASLKTGWASVWQAVEGYALIAFGNIANASYKLENKIIPGLGSALKSFDNWIGTTGDDIIAHGRKLVNGSKAVSTFSEVYRRELIRLAKEGKKTGLGSSFSKDVAQMVAAMTSAQFRKAQEDFANSIGDSTGKAAQLAKAHANAVQQATQNMTNTLNQAAQNLTNVYQQLQQQNQQALGGLFQGPTMQGIFGQVFGQINDTLRQFGVQIPIPFNILRQDLDQSVTYFKRWRKDIISLLKRGAPPEFVMQIQELGPQAGIPIAEGLLAGGKSGFKSLIKEWKKGQDMLDNATKQDMNRKLKYWNSFGKDAAWQTIMGIIDNPKNAQIQNMYRTYVKKTFGSILQDQFKKDVAAAMADAIQNLATVPTGPGAKPPSAPGAGRVPARERRWMRDIKQAQTDFAARTAALQVAGKYYVSPQSQGGIVITGAEQRVLTSLIDQRVRLQNRIKRERELLSISRQLRTNPINAAGKVEITYHGDTVTVKADGATPAAVMRALKKKEFLRKHRHTQPRRGTSGG